MMTDKKIALLVEDDTSMRELIRIYLENLGYAVIEAVNGDEAIGFATESPPHVILMDLNMPIRGGLDAARCIRKIEDLKDIPIIIMSGYGKMGIEFYSNLEGMGTAPIEYLPKPFCMSYLTKLLNNLVIE